MQIDFTQRNYPSLILAGLGILGQGILRLGDSVLRSFDQILLADLEEEICRRQSPHAGQTVFQGDIQKESFLIRLLEEIRPPILFVNVCSNLDTVKLRRFLADRDVGYVDVCASAMEEETQSRFSRLMPYTNTACGGRFPHLICQGINPGLVEYAARLLLNTFSQKENELAVSIFENDQLYSPLLGDATAVGWSPKDLVEEVMISPSMEVNNKEICEDDDPGAREVPVFWGSKQFSARLVGHEDIWNLGMMDRIGGARFLYTLHPDVMKTFCDRPAETLKQLTVPEADMPLEGTETVVVKVSSQKTGLQKALLWQTDHGFVQRRYKVNAVQYQAALGALLAMALMQFTEAGRRKGTFNASTLPLTAADHEVLVFLMQSMGIEWKSFSPDAVQCKWG